MSGSLNKIQLIGHIGNDPKLHNSNSGQQFATASIATNEKIKKNGGWDTITEWHNLVFWSGFSKTVEFIKKGQKVYIEGKMRSNEWVDKNKVKHQSWSVFVTNIQFLSHEKSQQKQKGNEFQCESSDVTPQNVADENLAAMHAMLSENQEGLPNS